MMLQAAVEMDGTVAGGRAEGGEEEKNERDAVACGDPSKRRVERKENGFGVRCREVQTCSEPGDETGGKGCIAVCRSMHVVR